MFIKFIEAKVMTLVIRMDEISPFGEGFKSVWQRRPRKTRKRSFKHNSTKTFDWFNVNADNRVSGRLCELCERRKSGEWIVAATWRMRRARNLLRSSQLFYFCDYRVRCYSAPLFTRLSAFVLSHLWKRKIFKTDFRRMNERKGERLIQKSSSFIFSFQYTRSPQQWGELFGDDLRWVVSNMVFFYLSVIIRFHEISWKLIFKLAEAKVL